MNINKLSGMRTLAKSFVNQAEAALKKIEVEVDEFINKVEESLLEKEEDDGYVFSGSVDNLFEEGDTVIIFHNEKALKYKVVDSEGNVTEFVNPTSEELSKLLIAIVEKAKSDSGYDYQ
jgi:cell division GTPase FtsZ